MWNSSQLTKAESLLEPIMTWRKSSTSVNALSLSYSSKSFFLWIWCECWHGLFMTFVLLWQAGNSGFRHPFEDRSVYPSPRFFFSELLLQGGNLSSDRISMDQQSCFVLTGWVSNHSCDCIWCREGLFDIAWYVRMSQDSVWNSFLSVPPSAVMGRYCLHRLPRRALACGEKQKKSEVEGPVSSGSTLLCYTCYCRTLNFEAITEG